MTNSRVLSDDDIMAIVNPFNPKSPYKDDFHESFGFAREIEAAVLAKVAEAEPVKELPLTGHWQHGNGYLVSGTSRIAHADSELFYWMSETLNAAIIAAAPSPAQAAPELTRAEIEELIPEPAMYALVKISLAASEFRNIEPSHDEHAAAYSYSDLMQFARAIIAADRAKRGEK